LRYLRDPQLERNVHRSQNRIESYRLKEAKERSEQRIKGTPTRTRATVP